MERRFLNIATGSKSRVVPDENRWLQFGSFRACELEWWIESCRVILRWRSGSSFFFFSRLKRRVYNFLFIRKEIDRFRLYRIVYPSLRINDNNIFNYWRFQMESFRQIFNLSVNIASKIDRKFLLFNVKLLSRYSIFK